MRDRTPAAFCTQCGSASDGNRFCTNCGHQMLGEASATSADGSRPATTLGGSRRIGEASTPVGSQAPDSQSATAEGPDFGDGEWIVGSEIRPGLYRFSGTMSRQDASGQLIDIEVAYNGLGLCKVLPSDDTVTVMGWATRADRYGPFDVLEHRPADGKYLVGIDIAPGRYRLSSHDDLASWTTWDRNMNIIDIRNNAGNILLQLDASVFAVTIYGTLQAV